MVKREQVREEWEGMREGEERIRKRGWIRRQGCHVREEREGVRRREERVGRQVKRMP